MFQVLYFLVHAIAPIIVPLCFVCAPIVLILVGLSIWSAIADSFAKAKQMHCIPCANCQYFTGDYSLKCTVRPSIALSESAINCSDYSPVDKF